MRCLIICVYRGEMLYSFYGSEALDEKSPRFFEKSKNMQKVLTKSRSAKQVSTYIINAYYYFVIFGNLNHLLLHY